ncbi:NAD(P)H-hydrate dehydratase [Desmospora profundinema]|uniref:Bifunctional NAD(P)H-hydrate repair enzyme n=1 Tax=Desmospora profundinema TaxID=1571184 RepID=A0ABU1IS00_9BACL|nr:NAD(P)H-hydrate dehydratase [Desmospora profundinema]MDR6227576.1 NAD(P)H-hydrate epimerase [Desmospora profundinema]
MYLYTAQEMRDLDRYTIETVGVPGSVLMENAGQAVTRLLHERDPGPAKAVVLAGTGNNGGDGFVIARLLASAGWQVRLWQVGQEEKMSPETRIFRDACQRSAPEPHRWEPQRIPDLTADLRRSDWVIDALLGTGVRGELREPFRTVIALINREAWGRVLAVDIPSGVETDSGAVAGEAAVRADWTVTLAGPKWGHYLLPGAEFCGELTVAEIGIPASVVRLRSPLARLNGPDGWEKHLAPRSPWSHKGTHGHLLVVGGSRGMLGAAALSAMAAYRTGVGMVTVGVPQSQETAMASQVTESLVWGWPDQGNGGFADAFPAGWEERKHRFSAVAVGPGLGPVPNSDWLRRFLSLDCPVVLDADALNALSRDPAILREAAAPVVLTPHPGEMARLTGSTVSEVEGNRPGVARDWAREYGVFVVLKGTHTLIASPGGSCVVEGNASPSLAKAGSGDVLTGVTGAWLARGVPPAEAAALSVHLHGLAGRLAVTDVSDSVIATDVIRAIGPALHRLIPSRSRA